MLELFSILFVVPDAKSPYMDGDDIVNKVCNAQNSVQILI